MANVTIYGLHTDPMDNKFVATKLAHLWAKCWQIFQHHGSHLGVRGARDRISTMENTWNLLMEYVKGPRIFFNYQYDDMMILMIFNVITCGF